MFVQTFWCLDLSNCMSDCTVGFLRSVLCAFYFLVYDVISMCSLLSAFLTHFMCTQTRLCHLLCNLLPGMLYASWILYICPCLILAVMDLNSLCKLNSTCTPKLWVVTKLHFLLKILDCWYYWYDLRRKYLDIFWDVWCFTMLDCCGSPASSSHSDAYNHVIFICLETLKSLTKPEAMKSSSAAPLGCGLVAKGPTRKRDQLVSDTIDPSWSWQ